MSPDIRDFEPVLLQKTLQNLQLLLQSYNILFPLLATNGISEVKENSDIFETISGKISAIAPIVIEGNTHYYIALENSDRLFDINMSDENLIAIIRYQIGDMIELTYSPEENGLQTVTQIKRM